MVATNHRSTTTGHCATSRGANRHSSDRDDQKTVELTLNSVPDCALDWLKESVFWNQFGRKEESGYGKILRLRKSESSLLSWGIVLDWLKAPERLNGANAGTINCEIARSQLKLYAQIHKEEIIFVLKDCVPKIKKR